MGYDPLEYLAECYGNVVIRDRDGNPGVFVRFDKCMSSDLDPSLPNHVHPAFIINGKEQEYILIGKYKGAEVKAGGAIYSAPNAMPVRSQSIDTVLPKIRSAVPGATSGMTMADHGLIKLIAQKNGWVPKGNTLYGVAYGDGSLWRTGQNYAAGNVRCFAGWSYTCREAHTSSVLNRPDLTPTLWEKGEQLGGVICDTVIDSTYRVGYRTLNGSGPLSWYMGGAGGIADIIGSSLEFRYGVRLVDCEIQIMENNDAADPAQDLGEDSGAWRAILPHAEDDGYELVEPGTSGTLHWNWTGSAIQLDNQCGSLTAGSKNQAFGTLTASARVPYVPCIMKELGLFPTGAEDETAGNFYVNFAEGESIVRAGGAFSTGGNSGLGSVRMDVPRSTTTNALGCRPRALI